MSTSAGVELGQGSQAGSSSGRRKEIAYLGPDGTYGQQAARAFVKHHLGGLELDNIPCTTISDAYERDSEYTVLPLENTIFGPVTETLDCFFTRLHDDGTGSSASSSSSTIRRTSGKGKEKEIIAILDLPIRHCLVAMKGTKMEDITIVKSHEQALGQSSNFLSKYLPNAKRIPTDSTAAAAKSLLSMSRTNGDDPSRGRGDGVSAAICSESVVDIYPELEVLHKGTQDRSDNFTRFILLKRNQQDYSRLDPKDATERSSTLTSKSTPLSSFHLLDNPSSIARLPNTSNIIIASLHTRPITPTISDKRTYPQGVFVELRFDANSPLPRSVTGNGTSNIGSGPVVSLEPI